MAVALSHFTMVGFDLDTSNATALRVSMGKYWETCETVALDSVDTLCHVKDKSGAELWLGVRREGRDSFIQMSANPALQGIGRTDVVIDGDMSDPAEKPFEISISAHFAGDSTPVAFDLADARDAAVMKPGTKATVDITAFSFEPSIFTGEDAYAKSQAGTKAQFAVDYFIPSGSFRENSGVPADKSSQRPRPYADFSGTVLQAELRNNAAGGRQYWWASVKTYAGATFDVVMDPSTVKTEPKPGSIVSGQFWLSAHVVPSP